MKFNLIGKLIVLGASVSVLHLANSQGSNAIAQLPLFLGQSVKPLAMLNLSVDHQLFFEAYPDYADLNNDGRPDNGYVHAVDYFGYFDPYKCYSFVSGVFEPQTITSDKFCDPTQTHWSGNFLNWATMTRIDVVRKILYGGNRSTDTATDTILERSYIPNDAHSFVKHYAGPNLRRLTPFDSPAALEATSSTSITIPTPSKNDASARRTFTLNNRGLTQIGDQVEIISTGNSNNVMRGVVRALPSTNQIEVQVTGADGVGASSSSWNVINRSREGVSFCNTTYAASGFSQNITAPPLLRVANGNFQLWTANERWQCNWASERNRTGHVQMQVGGLSFSNGNDWSATGLFANADNPTNDVRINEFIVRVRACPSGMIGTETCTPYGGNFKPTGLLQEFSTSVQFGLMTGSYARNLSGGVLRRNIGDVSNEVNQSNGVFITPTGGGIVSNLSALRIFGYNHNDGTYENSSSDGDNCQIGLTNPAEGRCTNWGNPQSELFLESLRYFAGRTNPNFGFTGNDRIPGLTQQQWQDPIGTQNYCAPLNIVSFNSSSASFDGDQLAGVADLPNFGSVVSRTDAVGAAEGIHGNSWFVGRAGTNTNDLCTGKLINSLGDVSGICPEAPRARGTFHIAGLAKYAWTNDLRPTLPGQQNVKTFGVTLAPAIPSIPITRPGAGTQPQVATILPACRNTTENSSCGFVDFKIISQDPEAGTGRFLVQWEAAEQGGDYDMDMNGILDYRITGNTIEVTTNVFAQSSSRRLGFGYVITGTTNNGFHVHSGINGFALDGCSGGSGCVFSDAPTSRSFTLGTSSADSLELPLFYAAKYGGFDKNRGINDPRSWDSNGDGIPDNYYFAINPAQLAADLRQVFTDLAKTNSTAASLAVNSTRLTESTRIYQARFNSEDWSGQFLAFGLNNNGTAILPAIWEASSVLPSHTNRRIFTIDPAATGVVGRNFLFNDPTGQGLTTAQRTHITSNALTNFLRGDGSGEIRNGGTFRDRSTPLGAIVNSNPAFLGRGTFGFESLPGAEGTSYTTFLASKSARPQVLFVGSSGGMMHAFNEADGVELFAFVPNNVIPNMPALADPNYIHRYLVDGTPRVVDVYMTGTTTTQTWRSVLIASTGAGGNSVFALDVTNPATFDRENVMWEFTHPDMGVAIPQPTIARMRDGNFYAIMANGYNSANGRAVLFLRNMNTGNVITIDTGVGSPGAPNGLSTPLPYDRDGDRIVDVIYAGDLQGNLWEFDVSQTNSGNWNNANNRQVLIQARDPNGNVQKITSRPEAGRVDGVEMVFFGTGSFFFNDDNFVSSGEAINSLYGIIPSRKPNNNTIQRANMVQQDIFFEGTDAAFGDRGLRVVSDNPFGTTALPNPQGWYMDLTSPPVPPSAARVIRGERSVVQPQLRRDRIIFVTLIPSVDPCQFGGTSWTLDLAARSGGRLPYDVFDVNNDGLFNSADAITINGVVFTISGLRSTVGIIPRQQILEAGTREFKCAAGTTGELECLPERPAGDTGNDPNNPFGRPGRMSWRELR